MGVVRTVLQHSASLSAQRRAGQRHAGVVCTVTEVVGNDNNHSSVRHGTAASPFDPPTMWSYCAFNAPVRRACGHISQQFEGKARAWGCSRVLPKARRGGLDRSGGFPRSRVADTLERDGDSAALLSAHGPFMGRFSQQGPGPC